MGVGKVITSVVQLESYFDADFDTVFTVGAGMFPSGRWGE